MGIVLIITLAFGLITPPYGFSLLMASKFIRVRFSSALRASLPIYVIFFATIVFAIFFPKAVLWLPKMPFPEIGRLLQGAGRREIHLPVTAANRTGIASPGCRLGRDLHTFTFA